MPLRCLHPFRIIVTLIVLLSWCWRRLKSLLLMIRPWRRLLSLVTNCVVGLPKGCDTQADIDGRQGKPTAKT